jgi:hypothetical protein
MNYESTADFKHRLAIAGRIARGEGKCSIIGSAHANPCVVRSKVVRDCTYAVEQADRQYRSQRAFPAGRALTGNGR